MLSSRSWRRPMEVSRQLGPATALATTEPGHCPPAGAQLPVPSPSERRIGLSRLHVLVKAVSGRGPWAVTGLQPSQKRSFLGLGVEQSTLPAASPKAGDYEVFIHPKGAQDCRKTLFTETSGNLVPTNCGIVIGSLPILPFIHFPQSSPNGNSIMG